MVYNDAKNTLKNITSILILLTKLRWEWSNQKDSGK